MIQRVHRVCAPRLQIGVRQHLTKRRPSYGEDGKNNQPAPGNNFHKLLLLSSLQIFYTISLADVNNADVNKRRRGYCRAGVVQRPIDAKMDIVLFPQRIKIIMPFLT